MLWVGVDVGGTFTDAVLYDEAATELRYAKAPSTPADPTEGVLHALQRPSCTVVARLVALQNPGG